MMSNYYSLARQQAQQRDSCYHMGVEFDLFLKYRNSEVLDRYLRHKDRFPDLTFGEYLNLHNPEISKLEKKLQCEGWD